MVEELRQVVNEKQIGGDSMSDLNINDIRRRMDARITVLQSEFSGLRAGRASTGMLEPLMVEAYGAKLPMNQVGTISAPEPRLLTILVWDSSMVQAVERAIRDSNLGLNPAAEGTLIRVPIPDLSEERRKEMVKVASRYAEACRVSIRNIRRDSIESIRKSEKEGLVSEDERHSNEGLVQKLTDEFVKNVDEALSNKEKEITQI